MLIYLLFATLKGLFVGGYNSNWGRAVDDLSQCLIEGGGSFLGKTLVKEENHKQHGEDFILLEKLV